MRGIALRVALGLVCLAATFSGLALGALEIKGEMRVKRDRLVRLSATGQADGAALVWDVSDEDKCDVEEVSGRLLMSAPPGTYKVKLRAIRLDKDGRTSIETARATVVVEGEPDPQPPTPPPGPTPPAPGPAPIPTKGLRVLIVYESADLAKLPAKQRLVFDSKLVADYLNSACVKDGKQPEWRVWDADTDTGNATQVWKDAMKRERKSLPWVLISNGTSGYEGPLPGTVEDTLALLKKYAAGRQAKKGARKR